MPTQRGRARHPPGPARSGLPLGLVARGCDGPARCRLAGAAAPSASRAQPAPQRSALNASPPCAPRTARGVGGARARSKRGRGRQSQFAHQRPLPSRGALTSTHQDQAGRPLKQSQRAPGQLSEGAALEGSKLVMRLPEGGLLLSILEEHVEQLERNAGSTLPLPGRSWDYWSLSEASGTLWSGYAN